MALKSGKTKQPTASSTPTPTSSTNTASSSTASSSSVPLQHYFSRVPLQLAALFFALYTSSSRSLPPSTPPNRILQSLILDPVSFLSSACGSIAVIQIWFGVWTKGLLDKSNEPENNADEGKATSGEKRQFGKMMNDAMKGVKPTKASSSDQSSRGKKKGRFGSFRFESLLPALATTVIGAVGLHLVALCLGASLVRKAPETFLLSLLISILAFLPIAITFGAPHPNQPEHYLWIRLFSSLAPRTDLEIALLAPALGALGGAWLGAVPIPLDWDRPWQKWPTTCVVGSLLGYGVGSVVALVMVAMGLYAQRTTVAKLKSS